MEEIDRIKLAIKRGITYDPVSGLIYGVKNNPIKDKTKNGYIHVRVQYKTKRYCIKGHRFAYYMIHGELPEFIDHINRDKSDNRASNLRAATRSENQWNNDGKNYYLRTSGKYEAYITVNAKRKYLGVHETKKEARKAYLNAKKKFHIINDKTK